MTPSPRGEGFFFDCLWTCIIIFRLTLAIAVSQWLIEEGIIYFPKILVCKLQENFIFLLIEDF